VLVVDGVKVGQSHAIERFLARRFNLMGDNDVEAAQIDAIGEHLVDIKETYKAAKKQDEKAMLAFGAEKLTALFAKLEAQVSKQGWLVGSRMSLADVQWSILPSFWDGPKFVPFVKKALEASPKLAAIVAKVAAVPAVKAWRAARPVTFM
jgi:glutathione S-transferase